MPLGQHRTLGSPRSRGASRGLRLIWSGVLLAVGPTFVGTLPAQLSPLPPAVINEIHYHPPNKTQFEEFIELHNPGAAAVGLEGWRLEDGVQFTFPAGTSLAGGGYLVVAQDPLAFRARFGFTPLGPWVGVLNNQGERLQLRDLNGHLVDEVSYEAGFPWPTQPAGGGLPTTTGYSAELIHPTLDRNLGGSWRASLAPETAPTTTFIGTNDPAWHYRKGTNEASTPISAWRRPDFLEDASWRTGRTSIGYGDGDDRTILTDMYGNYICLFLRHTFFLAPGEIPGALRLRLRVDDGCVVWINGTEVARAHLNAGEFAYNAQNAALDHEASLTAFEEFTLPNAMAYLGPGTNVLALQVFNFSLSNADLTIDAELVSAQRTTSPTPGARNSVWATNAPPAIRQVTHQPAQPVSAEPVLITAKVTDPQGVAAVHLSYQVVEPGRYLRKTDAAFLDPSNWVFVPMNDAGVDGDAVAGDAIYSVILPATVQAHRRLVRYRLHATDGASPALSVTVPYEDDGSPNFAYFVHAGIPAWSGASKPSPPNQTPLLQFPAPVVRSLQAYHLLADPTDVANSQFNSSYDGARMPGTLVVDGQVYDHIEFYNRGEYSTYVSGKNKWRLRANLTHRFRLRDDYGRRYHQDWDEISLDACASPWASVNRGMAGLDEVLSIRAYQLAGVATPNVHYLQWRVIDGPLEASPTNQYDGDLWGLYLAKETPDGSFLDERGLPDGNTYKLENSAPDKKNQGPTQPETSADWSSFAADSASRTVNTVGNLQWWRTNLHLPTYYSARAIDRLVGNIDLRNGWNYYFYHHPAGPWYYVPWDLDMMFIPTVMHSGVSDQGNCLLMAPLLIEFHNRARELLDLLGSDSSTNGGQFGQLLDEYAQLVNPRGQALTWADLDECLWNWNPNTQGTGANTGLASHKGNFYRSPYYDNRGGITWTRTLPNAASGYGNLEGFLQHLGDYTRDSFPAGLTWVVNNGNPLGYGYKYLEQEGRDSGVPLRPTLTYVGPTNYPANDLRLQSSPFRPNPTGGVAFAALQWRLGEISAPGLPLHDPTQPRRYEIEPLWTSPETTNFSALTRLPFAVLRPGHTYRARVRHQDTNGRWSRWSEPVQFAPSAPEVGVYTQSVVITEIMYHPPGATLEEAALGYSGEDFEYLQLRNVGDAPVDLTDVRFTKGVNFDFPAGFTLPAGGSAYVVRNEAAFLLRYGSGKTIAGAYGPDNLANDGEHVKLSYGAGTAILDFTYGTSAPWPSAPDGQGYCLQLLQPQSRPNPALPENWRAGIQWASWAAAHGGLAQPLEDADRDGLSALMEYALGSDPRVASVERPLAGTLLEGCLALSFRRQPGAADLDYTVEFSFDLVHWTQDGVWLSTTPNPDGTVTETWRGPSGGAGQSQYARLRVTLKASTP